MGREVQVPECFAGFRGQRMKNAVQNETESYALSFGENSEFNKITLRLFKEFGAKSVGEKFEGKEPRSCFTMMQDFN